jgi:hypothetical protein
MVRAGGRVRRSGHPAHLLVQGGTAIAQKDLSRLTVIVVRGRTLLSIPV